MIKKGMLLCFAAAIQFGIAPVVIKFTLSAGLTIPCLMMYSNIFSALAAFIAARRRGHSLMLPPRNLAFVCACGAAGLGMTQLMLGSALTMIPAGTATVIHFLYPTIVTIASAFIFAKPLNAASITAAVLSIAGMVMISLHDMTGSADSGMFGILLALGSAFSYSAYMTANESFGRRGLPVSVTYCYMSLSAAALFTAISSSGGSASFIMPAAALPSFAAYCVIHAAAFMCLNIGISLIGASEASFSTLLEPLTALVVSAAVFGDELTLSSAAGAAMILVSVRLVSGDENKDAD